MDMYQPSSLLHLPLLSPPVSSKFVCSSAQNNAYQPPFLRLAGQGAKLVGCGSAVPTLEVTNDDLAKIVDTNDEWISVRTGIRKRRILSDSSDLTRVTTRNVTITEGRPSEITEDFEALGKETMTSLSVEASRKALEMAKVDAKDIDLILVGSSSSDDLFGTGPQISSLLGCTKNPAAYNITAACTGFVLSLISAASHIRGSGFQNVLVIGADAISRHVDWTDRSSCILFGDAAGAAVVQACNPEEDGLFSFDLHSDGDGYRHLNASHKVEGANNESEGGVLDLPHKKNSYSCIHMNGKEVFKFAVRTVPQSIEIAIKKADIPASKIDWLLLHQANQRIIDAVANKLEFSSEKVISNVSNYGNTSAASIPLALDESVRSGKIKEGDIIAASGFGAGLTWGSSIFRWG